jgi:hypothetical protein
MSTHFPKDLFLFFPDFRRAFLQKLQSHDNVIIIIRKILILGVNFPFLPLFLCL